MTTHLAPNRFAPRPTITLIHRAKTFLTAIVFVAAAVLVVAGSWPLKVLAVLAFARGLFASDIIAVRRVLGAGARPSARHA
jgi:hypothetical protein